MAHIGSTCSPIGSPDWYIGDQETYAPVAGQLFPGSAHVALNTIARIDAGSAISTDPLDEVLHFEWSIIAAPPKSERKFRTDGSSLFLTIDDVGAFGVKVVVSTANGGCSNEAFSILIAQPIAYASEPLQVYDVSWLWSLLPDFWGQITQKDRARFESIWRGLQQLMSSDITNVLNLKDSLSIATIQDRVLKKWVRVDFEEPLDTYRVKITDDEYTVSSIQNNSVNITEDILSYTDSRHGGRLIKTNTFLSDSYNVNESDIGKSVRVEIGKEVHNVTLLGIHVVGERRGAVLSKHIPIQKALPVECAFIMRTPITNEIGAIKLEDSFGSGEITSPNSIKFTAPNVPTTAMKVRVANQLYVEDAFLNGVRRGDSVNVLIIDEANRSVPLRLNVSDCVGDYVVLEDLDWRALVADVITTLGYEEAEERTSSIINEVQTSTWRNKYLRNWYSGDVLIEFGAGTSEHTTFIVRITSIDKRTTTRLSKTVAHLVRLTERSERVIVSDDGVIQTEAGELFDLGREPVSLIENLDFYVQGQSELVRNITRVNENTLEADHYNFEFCGIVPGSIFDLTHPFLKGTYTVISVEGKSLTVSPILVTDFANATIEFRGDPTDERKTLILEDPLPIDVKYLWAETSVESNSESLEYSFGELVGVPFEPWSARNLSNSYKDALLGLLYARVMQPSLDIVQTAVGILAGVPFAPKRSRIHDIQEDYLLDAFGQPRKSRITLEEIDESGTRTERFSSYLFPSSRPDRDAEYSGLAFNDESGQRYTQGDIIEKMQSIALGVKVYDLYTGAQTYSFDPIKDRHRFLVRIDTDSAQIYTGETVEFIYDFIVEIKPAYTSFILALQKYVVDDIIIDEDIFWAMRTRMYDNPYHHRGPANVLDDNYPDVPERDLPIIMPLTTWFPSDGVLSKVGAQYTLSSVTGGFADPSPLISTYRSQPWIRQGDFIVLRDTGCLLTVTSITSDTELVADAYQIRKDERSLPSYSEQGLRFYVARPRLDTILDATLLVSNDPDFSFSLLGDLANDIGLGDVITLPSGPMLRVVNKYEDATGTLFYETYPSKPSISGLTQVKVFREQICDRVLYDGDSSISQNTAETPFITLPVSALSLGIEPGDEIRVGAHTAIVTLATTTGVVGLSEPLDATEYPKGNYPTVITRFNTNEGADDLDEHERAIESSVQFYLKTSNQLAIEGGLITDTESLLRPGDLIYNMSDANTSDYGEGSGIARIVAPVSGMNNQQYYTSYSSSYNITGKFVIIKQAPLKYSYFLGTRTAPQYMWGQEQWRLPNG